MAFHHVSDSSIILEYLIYNDTFLISDPLPVPKSISKTGKSPNASIKLATSTAITPLSPIKEYNAVAIKGFNMDISDLDNEQRPLVF